MATIKQPYGEDPNEDGLACPCADLDPKVPGTGAPSLDYLETAEGELLFTLEGHVLELQS